jgi:hypothetical protein
MRLQCHVFHVLWLQEQTASLCGRYSCLMLWAIWYAHLQLPMIYGIFSMDERLSLVYTTYNIQVFVWLLQAPSLVSFVMWPTSSNEISSVYHGRQGNVLAEPAIFVTVQYKYTSKQQPPLGSSFSGLQSHCASWLLSSQPYVPTARTHCST